MREDRGMTQSEAARRIGISRQGLWKIESGLAKPTAETLRGVARTYGVSADTILNTTMYAIVDAGEQMQIVLREEDAVEKAADAAVNVLIDKEVLRKSDAEELRARLIDALLEDYDKEGQA
jgi:transcriptional regulator with XRE-family HTH domain